MKKILSVFAILASTTTFALNCPSEKSIVSNFKFDSYEQAGRNFVFTMENVKFDTDTNWNVSFLIKDFQPNDVLNQAKKALQSLKFSYQSETPMGRYICAYVTDDRSTTLYAVTIVN